MVSLVTYHVSRRVTISNAQYSADISGPESNTGLDTRYNWTPHIKAIHTELSMSNDHMNFACSQFGLLKSFKIQLEIMQCSAMKKVFDTSCTLIQGQGLEPL